MNVAFRRLGVLLAVTGLAVVGLVGRPVLAKSAARSATSHAVSAGRGARPAVKMSRDAVNQHPVKRAGGKARSGALHIDNESQWYIDIYVNGDYAGSVGPYGDLYLYEPEDVVTVSGSIPGTDRFYGARDIGVPGVWHLYN